MKSNPRYVQAFFVLCALLIFVFSRLAPGQTSGLAAPGTEELWAVAQKCDGELDDAKKSIDGSKRGFDGKTAECKFESGSGKDAWTYTGFEKSQLATVDHALLEIGFFVSEWSDEQHLSLEISVDKGKDWHNLEQFDRQHAPPFGLEHISYDLSGKINSPEMVDRLQVRLLLEGGDQEGGELTIHLDAARLEVTGESLPTATQEIQTDPTQTQTPELAETHEPTPTTNNATSSPTATRTPASTTLADATPTQSPTPTGTWIPTGTQASSTTPGPSPTITPTSVFSGTLTLTPTGVISTTPTTPAFNQQPTLAPLSANPEILWGLEQRCAAEIQSAGQSVDLAFNGSVAACTAEFAAQGDWQFTLLESSTYTHIDQVILNIRLSLTGWVDDAINLELFDGMQWISVAQISAPGLQPPPTLTILSYDVTAHLNDPQMVNQASIRVIGAGASASSDLVTIEMDEVQLVVSGGYPPELDLPPIPTPGIHSVNRMAADASAADANSDDPHNNFGPLTDSCAGCHRSHTASGLEARAAWPEEALCFSCHASAGPGTNVRPAFTTYINSSTGFYKHDISLTNALHRLGQVSAGDFSGANRHVECEDCHNSHRAMRGPASPPLLLPEMAGISGTDPIWNSPGAPASFAWMTAAEREYQVCFKCHSSFSALPSYLPDGWNGAALVANGLRKLTSANPLQVPDSRDLGREFNPYQASFHPVAAQGRNQNIPAGSFVNGWTQTSLTYCSDCHNNSAAVAGGAGAHGSPLLHILDGGQNFSTVMTDKAPRVSPSQVCFTCHNYSTYVTGQNNSTNFEYHKKHMDNDWGTTCYTCHDSHGSEQLHLINFDASAMTFLNGRNSQSAWYVDPANGRAGCYLSCHGKSHNPYTYSSVAP